MREVAVELDFDAEQLASNCRRSVVLSVRDRKARTGMTLKVTPAGRDRLASELRALDEEHDRARFTLAADLEVSR